MSANGNGRANGGADGRVTRLLNQIRWVTRLTTSLSGRQDVDDIYSILISGLISPTGLGLSRVLVFEVSTATRDLVGRYSTGYESREQIDEITREMSQEEEVLREQMRMLRQTLTGADPNESTVLHALEASSPWITLLNRLPIENDETKALTALRYPLQSYQPNRRKLDFFSEASYWRSPRACTVSHCGPQMPAEVRERLHEHFATVPLFTSKGLRALLLVDRRFDEHQQFSPDDLEELAYFANQGALAIANAELIAELNHALADLRQVESIKSNFLSTISHELRTPLTAITGFLDLVLGGSMGTLPQSVEGLLARVAKNAHHMTTMVNDLIEVTEIDAEGMRDRQILPVDPLMTLMTTIPRLDNRRRVQKSPIEPIIPPTGVPRVLADEKALSRIFFHLLDNALKFSPGTAPVKVAFTPTNGKMDISVIDSGIGIPKEKVDRIFEQFYQVDNTLTRSQEGLGLGLSVIRMLLKSIGGTIRVVSTPGSGSTFTVTLPLAPQTGLEDTAPIF